MSTSTEMVKHRRPGGRTAEVSRRVNDAILDLVFEGGIAACTFAAVAERAGVERSTLYRRYGDRWGMMVDATLSHSEEIPPVSLGSFREDLRLLLHRMAEILATPLGPALWSVGAALRAEMAPEHRERFWRAPLMQILPIIEAARERGELPRNVDPEEILASALGAVHLRMLLMGQQLNLQTIDRIVDGVCRLHCRLSKSVKVKPPVPPSEIE